jgi:hypothetical protein
VFRLEKAEPMQILDVCPASAAARGLARFLLLNLGTVSISRHPGAEPDISGRAPERRIHHRVLVGAAAWLVTNDDRHAAECVNVSMGGAAINTNARIPTGTVVRFELSFGLDHRPVAIQCEVVRSSQTELGLRFLALDRASLEAVLSLL